MTNDIEAAKAYGRQCGDIASATFNRTIGKLDDVAVGVFFEHTGAAFEKAVSEYRQSGATTEMITAFRHEFAITLNATVQQYISEHGEQ